MEDILFEQKNRMGCITLNRPQALNALNEGMITALYNTLKLWALDKTVDAVLIKAKPGRAFCAGGDVRALYDQKNEPDVQQAFFTKEYALNQLIGTYSKPYIALLNGITMGGGVGISMLGSYPVGTPRLQFAMPETTIGFFPDVGASYLLSRMEGGIGMYLGLTGAMMDAYSCQDAGLIQHVISEEDCDPFEQALINTDLSSDPYAHVEGVIKRFKVSPNACWLKENQDWINHCFNQKTLKAVFEALEQEPRGQETLLNLRTKSPLALSVTFIQLQKARGLNLEACLMMDRILVEHFIKDHDFYEGVRALLIDKDKNPRWHPKTLDEVPMSMVNDYFIERRRVV